MLIILPHIVDEFCNKYYSNIIYRNIKARDLYKSDKINVGIIRDEGSNGHREMKAAFIYVGFNLRFYINDLIINCDIIDSLKGIIYVGGFSHADSLGAGQGWHSVIEQNHSLKYKINQFIERQDTFSMGICNGCQLILKQKYISQNVELVENDSKRFESRFSQLKF